MRKFICIGLLITFCYSCSKDSNGGSKFIGKYEVRGSSPDGYMIAYTNELGDTTYATGKSGWIYQINGDTGHCYNLTIIPGFVFADCNNTTGTINIFFDNALKAAKTVSMFTETVPDRFGGMSCGITTSACN